MKNDRKLIQSYFGKDAPKWIRKKLDNIGDLVARPYLVAQLKSIAKQQTVLDVGCGEGYISRQIAPIAKKVLGVDISADMINLAKKQIRYRNEEYRCLDVRNINRIKEKFDIIVISFVLHYLKSYEIDLIVKKISSRLKKGGRILLEVPNTYSFIKHKSSVWYKHGRLGSEENQFFELNSWIIGRGYKKVGFYSYGLSYYINAFINAGCTLECMVDLNPGEKLILKYPSLKNEKYLFLFLQFHKA